VDRVVLHSSIRSERPALAADRFVLTIGTFDGVHQGHQALLHAARAAADLRGAGMVVVTFDPLPRTVLGKGNEPPLVPVERRVALLHAHGADIVDVLAFDRSVAAIEYRRFVEALLDRYAICHAVLGYDFVLGRDRAGTSDRIEALGDELGFSVQSEPPVLDSDGGPISSSKIRQRILAGDISEAARMLGRPVMITGDCTVDGVADLDGSATLIRDVASRHMLPAPGTYAGVLNHSGGSIPVSVVVEDGDDPSKRVWRTVLPYVRTREEAVGPYALQLFTDMAGSVYAGTGSNAGYWG
jgi:riboflavin kinase / FMN adenylyltransferase